MVIVSVLIWSCGEAPDTPLKVVWFGLDGANWGIINELRDQERLPNLDRLIKRGSSGSLRSIQTRRLLRWEKEGIWSPVIWTTIATGKVPEKHGIEDFVLPRAGSVRRWLKERPVTIKLPGITAATELRMACRSFEGCSGQRFRLALNDIDLGWFEVPPTWTTISVLLPLEHAQVRTNTLLLEPATAVSPRRLSGNPADDPRFLSICLQSLELLEASGRTTFKLDLIRDRDRLGLDWHPVEVERETAASYHRKCKAVWNLMTMLGRRVGVIGYWATWPAEVVNGYIVSSNVGLRGWLSFTGMDESARKGLVYPPELLSEVMAAAPERDEADALFKSRLYDFSTCRAVLDQELDIFRSIFWQDELYSAILERQLEVGEQPDFLTVYFEGVDIASHYYWHFMTHPEKAAATDGQGCDPEALRQVIYREYERADQMLGSIIERTDRHTVIMVASDHGFANMGETGGHHLYGVLVLAGPHIREGFSFDGAGVEDVLPTTLYLMGYPIGGDMDGKVVYSAVQPEFLATHPLRFVPTYEDGADIMGESPASDIEGEFIDRLEGIGYLQ
ncbi:alkaline phosphatase family protein [bacterium]|nr:alkaline phosphatase family protein [candidate division CSSED10-310 bacterium]